MRGRSSTGYRRTPRIQAIEEEYLATFPEVIQGFADDGLNKSQVGAILGYDRGDFYRKLKGLERAGVTFTWPDPYASRWTVEYEWTPARVEAVKSNLAKARAGAESRWAREKKGTLELVQEATRIRAAGVPWRAVAFRLGVSICTLRRARQLHPVPDPIGNRLVREAQRKFKVTL